MEAKNDIQIFKKAKFQCCFCGRMFEQKMSHLCGKQFRKHKIKWIEV